MIVTAWLSTCTDYIVDYCLVQFSSMVQCSSFITLCSGSTRIDFVISESCPDPEGGQGGLGSPTPEKSQMYRVF